MVRGRECVRECEMNSWNAMIKEWRVGRQRNEHILLFGRGDRGILGDTEGGDGKKEREGGGQGAGSSVHILLGTTFVSRHKPLCYTRIVSIMHQGLRPIN